jgi:transcriptional regulator with XRE-family HTH domain
MVARNATSNVFGRRLREARESLGIAQDKLGVMIGLDEGCASARMSRYEKRHSRTAARHRAENRGSLERAAGLPALRRR